MPTCNVSWGVNVDGGSAISGLFDAVEADTVTTITEAVAANQTNHAIPLVIDVTKLVFLVVVQTGADTTTTIKDATSGANFTWTLEDGIPAGVWTENVDADLKPITTNTTTLYVTTGATGCTIKIVCGQSI